ncbi:hypothetical protein FEDK69T_17270 [Flavobacterium enshiense DK69]|uniref:Uncharacterized protein n=1 Tax=Flavobacterium enshiense DK69 TaxID=1107311 RepID=V6S8S0_9FLAO|nr:hypothetical protein [Flavobacterium enshiense]ESU22824.1 hypothetical protein FEDK69T_17270 [Flavobacterium enshiense DK69]KGO93964.1 hypothetical protein Q767_13530 [Flavobacterium enshiense DK69]
MRKVIYILAFASLTSFSSANVYICVSPNAKKYHYNENCRGLSNCKHEIKKVSKSEALDKGLGLCGWED